MFCQADQFLMTTTDERTRESCKDIMELLIDDMTNYPPLDEDASMDAFFETFFEKHDVPDSIEFLVVSNTCQYFKRRHQDLKSVRSNRLNNLSEILTNPAAFMASL